MYAAAYLEPGRISMVVCSANEWNSFYMIGAPTVKELIHELVVSFAVKLGSFD